MNYFARNEHRPGLIRALTLIAALTGLLPHSFSEARGADDSEAARRRAAYAGDMKQAQQALEAGDVPRARQLLEQHKPAAGAEDLRGFEWRHFWRRGHAGTNQAASSGPPRERDSVGGLVQTNTSSRLIFLADSRRLAATAADSSLRIYDATTLEAVHDVASAREPLHLMAEGRTLLTVGDGGLQFWDSRDEAIAPMWIFPRGGDWAVAAFAPTGWVTAVGFGAGKIHLMNLGVLRPALDMTNFPAHDGAVGALAFSPEGRTLASGGADKLVKLWDWSQQHCSQTLTQHTDRVSALAWSPDGRILASGSLDRTILFWDPTASAPPRRLEGHRQAVRKLAFAPDGRTLASGSADNTVRLWNVASGLEVAVFNLAGNAPEIPSQAVEQVAFSPDGNALAARLQDGTLRVWRAEPFAAIAADAIPSGNQ